MYLCIVLLAFPYNESYPGLIIQFVSGSSSSNIKCNGNGVITGLGNKVVTELAVNWILFIICILSGLALFLVIKICASLFGRKVIDVSGWGHVCRFVVRIEIFVKLYRRVLFGPGAVCPGVLC